MSMDPSPFLPQTTMAIEKVKIAASADQPIWKIIRIKFVIINITELQNFLIILRLKLISQKQNFLNRIVKKIKLGRLVLNHSTNIEGLIPILQKLALENNIKTITPAVISRARGRSSKLIIRLSVKTINGYKAIARKGNTAQEVFISTELSKDELKEIIDLYNKK